MPTALGTVIDRKKVARFELAAATDPLMNGLDTPLVRRHPLAVGQTRYAGEWVVAVVADTRALAEDATEKVRVVYEPLPFVMDAEEMVDSKYLVFGEHLVQFPVQRHRAGQDKNTQQG